MNTRAEREKLYIQKETELQRLWKNPLDSNWDFVKSWTDDELEKRIKDTIGQLKFERTGSLFKKSIVFVVVAFIALGILGILIFGIKQIF